MGPECKKGVSSKLTSQRVGPCTMLEELSQAVNRVRLVGESRVVVLHRDRLAPYRLFACPDRGTETDTLLPTPVLLPQATKAPQGNSWFLST